MKISDKAQDIIKYLINGNNKYVEEHEPEFFEKLKDAQNPTVTLITCSDSRVQTSIFGIETTDELFVIRNIGNQIINNFGSIDYGIYHLETPILLILGHTHCGAIKAVMEDYTNESLDIIKELDHLAIPLKMLKIKKEDSQEDIWLNAVVQNIDYQVKLAMSKYSEIIEQGKLTVVGMVDDFLNVYQKGEGRVLISNINGENNPKKLKNHHLFENLLEELKDNYFI